MRLSPERVTTYAVENDVHTTTPGSGAKSIKIHPRCSHVTRKNLVALPSACRPRFIVAGAGVEVGRSGRFEFVVWQYIGSSH